MWNEDTACNITKNEEVIECESGGAWLPLVAASIKTEGKYSVWTTQVKSGSEIGIM